MILALDVSSTAIGYALFEGPRRMEAGVIRPITPKEPEPCVRAYSMGRDVQGILDEHAGTLDAVLIERPPPTQGKRRSNPSAQHQAFGVIMSVVLGSKVRVECIHPATWTKNRKKEVRAADIIARHRLPPDVDKGHDAADAIGMCEWWITVGRHRTQGGADDAKPVRGRRRAGR